VSRLTLRGRVVVASIGVLLVALVGLSVGFNVLLDRRLDSDVSSVLRNRAAAQLATIDFPGNGVHVEEPPNDTALDHQAWVYAGTRPVEQPAIVAAPVRAAVHALIGTRHAVERSVGQDVRLLAVPLRDATGGLRGTVVVGVSLVPYEHTRHIALVASVILGCALLAAALLAVRASVRMALRPIGEMTERAADWSEHDLHRRFHLGPPRDELTALAATFDGLLRRIEAVLRHEQRLSAEIAHELRTPLTTVRGEVELALDGRAPEPRLRETLRLVHEEARRMEAVIDTLLASARAAEGTTVGSCDPVGPVRDAVRAVAGAAQTRAVEVGLTPPPDEIVVDAEPAMVSQAVYPLLENAVRHAATRVDVSFGRDAEQVVIRVADDGAGLQAADAFEPGISTTGGAGLGLPLARRLARSCGGDVVALDGHGPGARFELRLPGGHGRADVEACG
jgi:signal transduction histidine kinase